MRETSNAFSHRRRLGKEADATEPLGIQIRHTQYPHAPRPSIDSRSLARAVVCDSCRYGSPLRAQVQGRNRRPVATIWGDLKELAACRVSSSSTTAESLL